MKTIFDKVAIACVACGKVSKRDRYGTAGNWVNALADERWQLYECGHNLCPDCSKGPVRCPAMPNV